MKYHNLNGGIFMLFVLVTSLAGTVIAGDVANRGMQQDNRASGLVNQASCIVEHASQGDTQSAIQNLSSTSIGDPKLDLAAFAQKTKKLQIPFVANNGQVDERVKFFTRTFGGTVFVTKDGEIVYALPMSENLEDRGQMSENRSQVSEARIQKRRDELHSPNGIHDEAGMLHNHHISDIVNPASWIVNYDKSKFQNPKPTSLYFKNPKSVIQNLKPGVALREKFVGAKKKTIQGEEKSITQVNYFKGNDQSKWETDVSTYNMVNLGEIYKGIELRLKAYGDNVEKLFCVKPAADPQQIKIRLSGVKDCGIENPKLQINKFGELEVETEHGPVKFTKPVAYQEINGKRVEVYVEYSLSNPKSEVQNRKSKLVNYTCTYGFTVASYDKTKDLIIDPLLASTYLGGISYDRGNSIALDSSGNVYVTGYTDSFNFPATSGTYDTSYSGGVYADVFVSKLDSELTSLLASTYLGGNSYDWGYSLALDSSGNVYLTGYTRSSDFPTTSGAYDTSYNGDWDDPYYDVFVSKLDSELTSLLASTFLGGSGHDYGYSLTLDTSGNVYVTGEAWSKDFPTTSGAYDVSYNSGYGPDVFVAKLDGGLTSLLASTYLGGSDTDAGNSLTLDTSGNVYMTGKTQSEDFPTTNGAYDTSSPLNSNYYADVFVSKFDSGLTTLLASTFLGGSYWDEGESLALDTSGHVYVTGYTSSPTDFPTTSGAYDTSFNGNDYWTEDAFVSKLDGGLTTLLASTYLGGSGTDNGRFLALDTSGNVYVTGDAGSGFPTTIGAYDTSPGGIFISKLNGELTSLLVSTCLGGSGYGADYCRSLVLDTNGQVYVTGYTSSEDFPTTNGAYDTSRYDDYDVFVSKLDSDLSAATATPSPTPISVCEVGEITLSENKLTLNVGTSKGVIVTLTGKDGCIPNGVTIKTEINKAGRKRISVSPESAEANDSGETMFIITAKKKGSALLTFKSDGMKKKLMVKIKK